MFFNNKFKNGNSSGSSDILSSLKETHSKNIDSIDFLNNKIRICKDILKFSDKDIVVSDELEKYEYILFVFKYVDNLISEQILNYEKE